MNKSKLFAILRILVSLFLLAFLLWLMRENFAKIRQMLSSVKMPLFILTCLLFLSISILMAWRLKLLLLAQNIFFSIKELFGLTLIGYFFTNFMPTSVGGDLVKGYYVSKRNNQRALAYSSVFFDRVIGMFSFTLLATVGLLVMRKSIEHNFIFWAVLLLLSCCLAFGWSVFHRSAIEKIARSLGVVRLLQVLRLDSLLKKAYVAFSVYLNRKQTIIKALAISLFAQLVMFACVFLLAKSLAVDLPFGKVILVMPLILILCMLPVTMNGLGLREWAFIFFFSANIGEAAALSLSLLYLALFLVNSLIGGVIYLFWR